MSDDKENLVDLDVYRVERAQLGKRIGAARPRPAETYSLPIELDARDLSLTRGFSGEPRITLPGVDLSEMERFLPALTPADTLKLAEYLIMASRASGCGECMAHVTAEHLTPVRPCEHRAGKTGESP